MSTSDPCQKCPLDSVMPICRDGRDRHSGSAQKECPTYAELEVAARAREIDTIMLLDTLYGIENPDADSDLIEDLIAQIQALEEARGMYRKKPKEALRLAAHPTQKEETP